ncbi:Uncharacterised protein [uncultured Clostridium sp.]|nr:Uncharacterised protein [uncultured Clostridium sp.]SCI87159.1 Uncharacterised protein [uncultured Clostridium sp.]
MSHTLKKGEYEKAVEHVKRMLESNMGISDIIAKSNLSEEEVKNVVKKRQDELNDKKSDFY